MGLILAVVVLLIFIGLMLFKKYKAKESDVPQGIQVRDETGNIILDTNDSVVQFKGRIYLDGSTDGSLIFDSYPGGNAKFFYITIASETTGGNKFHPRIVWDPTTKQISWTFIRRGLDQPQPVELFYGFV